MKITPISESAVVCALPPPATLQQQRKLWTFAQRLHGLEDIIEVVVGMNNLTVFTASALDFSPLISRLETLWEDLESAEFVGRHVEIPVIYGGELGEDLVEVAQYHHCSPKDIIAAHSAPIYTVYMIGFQPGFPYLGGLPESLHTPRRAVPRTLVPAGSVGIGGAQTGVYPFASPGGWQLIGHTALPLFDKTQTPPTLLQAGDTVQFVVQEICL